MKNILYIMLILLITSVFSSCSVIGGIFNAGMSFGIFITVFIIVILLWLVLRGRNKNS